MSTARVVFRDFNTDGVPSSGDHEPDKLDIRELLTSYEALFAAIDARFGEVGGLGIYINIKDPAYEVVGDGTTDDSAAIQAIIDGAGSGATIVVPSGTYRADNLKLAGSSGMLMNITMVLMAGARIRARAAATNNVIVITGTGNRLIGPGRVSGSKDTGGAPVHGPNKGLWTASTAYAFDDRVEVSSSDAATTTVAASNLVYRCVSSHTSASTFAADKAAKWVLDTATANFNTMDLSYAGRNGVYVGNGYDCVVQGVEIDQCVYAGINLGSGPVQAANMGGAAQRAALRENRIHDCENGVAGGNWQACEIKDNVLRALGVYGIVADTSTNTGVISGNMLIGAAGSLHALYSYHGQNHQFHDNRILGAWTNGIIVDAAGDYVSVEGNSILTPTNVGIYVRASAVVKVVGNTVNGAGASGIEMSTVTGGLVGANASYGNAGAGIKLTSSVGITVNGNQTSLNTGPGIDAADSSNCVVTGNEARQNSHGIRSTGTSTGLSVGRNDFQSNGVAESLVGANVVGPNLGGSLGISHLGTAVAAATTPSAFVASTIITIKDSAGVTRYVPAANALW